MDIITLRWILHGRVQGVGMRFYVNRTAPKFGITGYVRNRYDGTVEILAQATAARLHQFQEHLKTHAPGNIERIIPEDAGETKPYHKFQIKLF